MEGLLKELNEVKERLAEIEARFTRIAMEATPEPYSGLQAALERLEGREARELYFQAFL